MENTTLKIEGMSCQMCVKHVTKALQGVNGVEAVSVSLDSNSADVQYDASVASMDAFKAAVSEAGYQVVGS